MKPFAIPTTYDSPLKMYELGEEEKVGDVEEEDEEYYRNMYKVHLNRFVAAK